MNSNFFTPFLLIFGFLSSGLFAQWTVHNFDYEGENREYRVYVPTGYDDTKDGSLVLSLHGLGTPLDSWEQTVRLAEVADTTNMIAVVPEAVFAFPVGTAWNSGAGIDGVFYPNSDVDDVGFLSEVIDRVIEENPSINPDYVFSMGFSMGGFMTQRLALELNDKITAFASAAGTFGYGIVPPTDPGRNVPILHFHGTADLVVPDINNTWGWDANQLIDFWIDNNGMSDDPEVIEIPAENNSYAVTHYVWDNGDDDSRIEYFQIHDLGHVWMGFDDTISFTLEAWRFFSRFISDDDELQTIEPQPIESLFTVYPNPASDRIYLKGNNATFGKTEITLTDMTGRMLLKKTANFGFDNGESIDISSLSAGVYLLQIHTEKGVQTEKVIVR